MAAHGIGRAGNGLGEGIARGDAETWDVILCASAPLRLCGRINLMHRETLLGCRPWHGPLWEWAWLRNGLRGDQGPTQGWTPPTAATGCPWLVFANESTCEPCRNMRHGSSASITHSGHDTRP